jgi:hypothetical protein
MNRTPWQARKQFSRSWSRRALGSAVVLVTACAAVAGTVPPATAASTAAGCPSVIFLGAAGAGELTAGHAPSPAETTYLGSELSSVLSLLKRQLPGTTINSAAVSYDPAEMSALRPTLAQVVGLPGSVSAWYGQQATGYVNSVAGAVTRARTQLLTRAAICPSSQFLLAGYSQGATVMHRLLTSLEAQASPVSARIAGVLLIGDADRVAGSAGTETGTATSGEGFTAAAGPAGSSQPVPAGFAGRTVSVCDQGDPVCDFSPAALSGFAAASKIHTTHYVSFPQPPKEPLLPTASIRTAVTFLAARVAAGQGRVAMSTPEDFLGLPSKHLAFSAVQGVSSAPAQRVTVTNVGTVTLVINKMSITGANSSQFTLATHQKTNLSIAPGKSATVPVYFRPTAPTGCPSAANPTLIGDSTRSATLTFSTNGRTGSATVGLTGVNSCAVEGSNEPVLSQLLQTLGYTTVVTPGGVLKRGLGTAGPTAGTDEIAKPYFTIADSAQPVTLTPIAHYGGRNTTAPGSQNTGWYLHAALPATPCGARCHKIWSFAPDTATKYVQNQKILPSVQGTTTFKPTGIFGISSGDGTQILFTDDGLNRAENRAGTALTPAQYLHTMRVYPAYGPGHVAIPHTYLIAVDFSRVTADKNNDFQDEILLLQNATPASVGSTVP